MNRGMASHERERERDTRERRTGDRTDRRISRPSRNSQTSVRSTTVSSGHSGVLMVGPNFRVGKKIGCGNFGELRLGEPTWVLAVLPAIYCIHTAPHHTHSHTHALFQYMFVVYMYACAECQTTRALAYIRLGSPVVVFMLPSIIQSIHLPIASSTPVPIHINLLSLLYRGYVHTRNVFRSSPLYDMYMVWIGNVLVGNN